MMPIPVAAVLGPAPFVLAELPACAAADLSYQSSKMLTHFRWVTPLERRRAFALASGQNI